MHLQLLFPRVLHRGRTQGACRGPGLVFGGCRAAGGIAVVVFLGSPFFFLLLDGRGAWKGGGEDCPAWTRVYCELPGAGEAWRWWGDGVPLWALQRQAGAGRLVG